MARPGIKGKPEIAGNTFRVYLHLLRAGASELRDVQRSLGFSTPSLASYHLGRLVEAGYVKQNERGQYVAVEGAAGDLLEGYTKLGVFLVPQLFFFALFFTAVVGFFAYMSLSLSSYVPLLVGTSLAMVAVLWYETFRVWRRLQSWRQPPRAS